MSPIRAHQIKKHKSMSSKSSDIDDTTGNDWENDDGGTLPWKKKPLCHFTWDLKVAVTTDYERIIRNIDHDLKETPNLLRIESLLFRAYLEICDDRKHWDVTRAREFLDRADECIEQTDARLRKGYRAVALLNHMWIEYKCHNTQKVADLLNELNSLKLGDKDHYVIGAVRAAALTRLGPHVMETALQLFEVTLERFPENVDFIYGAGLMTGKMAQYKRTGSSQFEKMDEEGQRLMNSEKKYWKKMMAIKDKYQLAKSYLGLNLSRRGTENERTEGCQHVREAYEKAPQVQELVRNVAQCYKGDKVGEAIAILKTGIERSPDCPESHFQLALCYISRAKRDKKVQDHKDYWNELAHEELIKCLDLDIGHNVASLKLCEVYSALGDHEEAEKIYETSLQKSEHWTTEDKLELYSGYAKFLDYTPMASRHDSTMDMWQKVMDVAVSIEYLDEASSRWKVSKKANKLKKVAYKRLFKSSLEVAKNEFQLNDLPVKEMPSTCTLSRTQRQVTMEAGQVTQQWSFSSTLSGTQVRYTVAVNQGAQEMSSTSISSASQSQNIMEVDEGTQQMLSTNTLSGSKSQDTMEADEGTQQTSSTYTLSWSQSQEAMEADEGNQQMSSTSTPSGSQSQETMEAAEGTQQTSSTFTLSGSQSQGTMEADEGTQQTSSTYTLSGSQSQDAMEADEGNQQMSSTSTLSGSQSQDKMEADEGNQQTSSTFTLSGSQIQGAMTIDQGAHQPPLTRAAIPLESLSIKSYREAVRCGSVGSSLELLNRLVSPQLKTTTPRSQFLKILAEIDLCCSRQPSVHLYRNIKPLRFKDDQLEDLSTVNYEKIQNHIDNLMQEDPFFTRAWEACFNMERRFLEERLTNNDKELELDGREEEADSTQLASKKTRSAGVKCCLHIRPLLDHIIVKFREKQLGIKDQETNLYFPLMRASKGSQNDNERKKETTEYLHKTLQRFFKIDTQRHYPKLFADLLEAQPCYDSKNDFLRSLFDVVNKYKHQTANQDELLDDPVKLSRQCMDKVEEICNFFFDTMKIARDMKKKVEQLEDDIRGGEHEKADELLQVLSNNEDFVVRIGSTWELLKKMALIRRSKQQQSVDDAESKLVAGEFGFSHDLRRCHLTVELLKADPGASSTELHEKCRDTCKEATNMLALVLSKKKPHGGQSATQQPMPAVTFPFCDLHPGVDRVDQWKGKVKKHLNKELNKVGIPGSVQNNKELLETVMQAQPCTDEENYQFMAVEQFLKQCDEGGAIRDTVSIKPNNQEEKTFQVLDLTRWITDNAEKIAIKIDTLKKVAGQ